MSFPSVALKRHIVGLIGKAAEYDSTIARNFANCVLRLNPPHNVFFGYSYESRQLLRELRVRNVLTVLCQTDCGPAYHSMIHTEQENWPEYAPRRRSWWTHERTEWLKEEWKLANTIIVNSEWTRQAIVSEGADPDKIEVLPLAYEGGQATGGEGQNAGGGKLTTEGRSERALRVLFLGTVSIGKGIHYLVEAAKLLASEPLQFTVAGPLAISEEAVAKAPANMHWLGHVPRALASEVYAQADVFVFPTLCDGFGLTQLEAMAHGLPVIATPNCGDVVQEGATGLIVPPRDSQALADALMKFVRNRSLVREMRVRCLETVKRFSVAAYGDRLVEIITERILHARR